MPGIALQYLRGGIAFRQCRCPRSTKKNDIYKFICIFSSLLHFSILLVSQQWEGVWVINYPQLTTMRKEKGGQQLSTIDNNFFAPVVAITAILNANTVSNLIEDN